MNIKKIFNRNYELLIFFIVVVILVSAGLLSNEGNKGALIITNVISSIVGLTVILLSIKFQKKIYYYSIMFSVWIIFAAIATYTSTFELSLYLVYFINGFMIPAAYRSISEIIED